jgi:serine/threonine-protein kinase ULK/ATG1
MAFCSGGDLSIYIKKRGKLPTLDLPKLMPDGTKDSNSMQFWPHPEEGGLDGAVTRCYLGQLSELMARVERIFEV